MSTISIGILLRFEYDVILSGALSTRRQATTSSNMYMTDWSNHQLTCQISNETTRSIGFNE
jgi:hypothetical protein